MQWKNDFALIKIRNLRKPVRGGVSSSEVGFKPSRKPVDTAGIFSCLPVSHFQSYSGIGDTVWGKSVWSQQANLK